jgi:UDPglucose--hexose-1-phosphate uridylyltransferase
VIVSTPRHVVRFSDLTQEEAARAVRAWAERLRATAEDARGLWPFLFLNQGAAAGASLQHSHAQLVGLPFTPPRLAAESRAFADAAACPVCEEIAGGEHRVSEANGLVAWCPARPPLSATVRIAPRAHAADWGEGVDADGVARVLRDVLGRIVRGFRAEALNVWLHQRGPGGGGRMHWHLEAVPRLGTLAGLELGSGVMAATSTQAEAAERLRAAAPDG